MGSEFDNLAKALASKSIPRRKVLKMMASAVLASAGSSLLGTAASAETTSLNDLPASGPLSINTPDPCINHPELCVNHTSPCVNGVGPCINTPDPCVNTSGQCDPTQPCFNQNGLCVNPPDTNPCINVTDPCVNALDPCFNYTGVCINVPEPPVNNPPPVINMPGPFGGAKPVNSPFPYFDKNGAGINGDIFDIRPNWPSPRRGNGSPSFGPTTNISRLKGRKF